MFNVFVQNAEWIAVIGGIIALAGTILVNVKSTRESKINEAKQEELLSLSLKLNGTLTGGDSYPLVSLYEVEEDFGIAQYSIHNHSEYPLYLTYMKITDSNETQKILRDTKNITHGGIPKECSLSEIMPKTALYMNTFPFQFEEGSCYSIQFTARNGTFMQYILTHKQNGRWSIAHQVRRFDGNTNPILFEKIPEGFPKSLLRW